MARLQGVCIAFDSLSANTGRVGTGHQRVDVLQTCQARLSVCSIGHGHGDQRRLQALTPVQ